MTVLAVLQSASARIIKRRPGVFFGSASQFEVELTEVVNAVAIDIAQAFEWRLLSRTAEIEPNGDQIAFPLPDDYDRMRMDTDISPIDGLSMRGWMAVPELLGSMSRPWEISGSDVVFRSPPAEKMSYEYITKYLVMSEGDIPAEKFTSDWDVFLLDDELLTLGVVYRWRQQNQLPAEVDVANFERRFSQISSKDSGARIIRSCPSPGKLKAAFPGVLGG